MSAEEGLTELAGKVETIGAVDGATALVNTARKIVVARCQQRNPRKNMSHRQE